MKLNRYFKILLFLGFLLRGLLAVAQPLNDNCETARVLTNIRGFNCSSNAAYTNVGATTSVV